MPAPQPVALAAPTQEKYYSATVIKKLDRTTEQASTVSAPGMFAAYSRFINNLHHNELVYYVNTGLIDPQLSEADVFRTAVEHLRLTVEPTRWKRFFSVFFSDFLCFILVPQYIFFFFCDFLTPNQKNSLNEGNLGQADRVEGGFAQRGICACVLAV